MINTRKPTTLIELALWSAYLTGEQPVSVLLAALPESGKTEIVNQFAANNGCLSLTDCTAWGIMNGYGDRIKAGKIRHIIIPDLVRPMCRNADTAHGLIAFLNSLIEEGVLNIATYAEHAAEGDEDNKVPVKCGLIATLARDMLEDGRRQYTKMGFISRMVPFSYSYTAAAQAEIRESIGKREYTGNSPIDLQLPEERSDALITLGEEEARKLIGLTTALIPSLTHISQRGEQESISTPYGFRLQKNLQRLAMANTLRDGRTKVDAKDIELIADLSSHMNFKYYPL